MRNVRRRLSLVLVAFLLTSALPLPALGADDPSDIPGVPLPSTVVSGLLGGPIYDVVYRINVPAGYVLLAGMTGSPGTDFDLYLYAPTATTVHSTDGVIAKSTGPTSTEQISWATRIPQTVYLDLNGASNVEGTFDLTVQVVPDSTPPQLELSVLGGAKIVGTAAITLQLAAFDDLSGVSQMSFSSDAVTWSPWEAFATTKAWTLPLGDGPKTIFGRVDNGIGLVSAIASTTVTLDTTPPTVVAHSPAPDTTVGVARPTIAVTFSEPIAPASWADLGLAVQGPDGAIVPGIYRYDESSKTGLFTPVVDFDPGRLYIATVGQVTDIAGNRVVPSGSWTVTYKHATSVALTAAPAVVSYGRPTTLSGRASIPLGQSASLQLRMADATTYTTSRSVAGPFSMTFVPPSNGWYRVTYGGSPVDASSAAGPVRVLVRRGIVLDGSIPAVTRTARAGRTLTVSARVLPMSGFVPVTMSLYRLSSTGRWLLYRAIARVTDSSGRAVVRWTPSPGTWAWRATVAPTPTYANNWTPIYRWSVSR